jgi:hypothetical protein
MRRARSAREMGWCVRMSVSAICRLISRLVLRVATRKGLEEGFFMALFAVRTI